MAQHAKDFHLEEGYGVKDEGQGGGQLKGTKWVSINFIIKIGFEYLTF